MESVPQPIIANDDEKISNILDGLINNAHRVYKEQGRIPFGQEDVEL